MLHPDIWKHSHPFTSFSLFATLNSPPFRLRYKVMSGTGDVCMNENVLKCRFCVSPIWRSVNFFFCHLEIGFTYGTNEDRQH